MADPGLLQLAEDLNLAQSGTRQPHTVPKHRPTHHRSASSLTHPMSVITFQWLSGWGAARRERHAYSYDRTCLLVSLIDLSNIIAEIMAYTEEKGNYSSPKFPQKPDFPR
jgi:hypothetical protein